jgi:hypothetical protein
MSDELPGTTPIPNRTLGIAVVTFLLLVAAPSDTLQERWPPGDTSMAVFIYGGAACLIAALMLRGITRARTLDKLVRLACLGGAALILGLLVAQNYALREEIKARRYGFDPACAASPQTVSPVALTLSISDHPHAGTTSQREPAPEVWDLGQIDRKRVTCRLVTGPTACDDDEDLGRLVIAATEAHVPPAIFTVEVSYLEHQRPVALTADFLRLGYPQIYLRTPERALLLHFDGHAVHQDFSSRKNAPTESADSWLARCRKWETRLQTIAAGKDLAAMQDASRRLRMGLTVETDTEVPGTRCSLGSRGKSSAAFYLTRHKDRAYGWYYTGHFLLNRPDGDWVCFDCPLSYADPESLKVGPSLHPGPLGTQVFFDGSGAGHQTYVLDCTESRAFERFCQPGDPNTCRLVRAGRSYRLLQDESDHSRKYMEWTGADFTPRAHRPT